ncbi:MAG: hypothetical protein A2W33_04600 [Chloroflexi bacterium RBG_16_52_11]|nr:MAG: hypothetical protein A2W33_04600 [Chloroflexi bacterium RBG_16_52_11]
MSYIIAVANQKGGVAKTTTAVSLGGALVKNGYQVLLIDLDSQADLTLGMGLNPRLIRGSIADVLLSSSSITSLCRETNIPGLDLIPSNSEMDLAEQFLPVRKNYEYILRSAFANHLPANMYDTIILDCPPALGAVTYNALNAAHLLLIPTQPEYFSAHALKNMMQSIQRVRSEGNPALQYRILITMQDCRNRIHRNLSQELRNTFHNGVLDTVIEVDTKLRESSIAGMPITHYISRTRSATQYQALAQELTRYVQETIAQPAAA